MTPVFRAIDGGVAVLCGRNGFYHQCPLYALGDQVFAKVGSHRFVKLYMNGGTTNLGLRIEAIDLGTEIAGKDALGRMVLLDEPEVRPRRRLKAVTGGA